MNARSVPCPPWMRRRSAQVGFILSYVLYSLLLLSLVTLGMSQMRAPNDRSAEIAKDVDQIDHDIDTLLLGVNLCATEAPLGATVDGVNTAYPLVPGATPGSLAFGAADATEMRCPGLAPAVQPMWTGRDGVFFPAPPSGLTAWRYAIVAGTCGRVSAISFAISATNPPANAVLRRAQLRRPVQRSLEFDAGTGAATLTVQVLSDPCPT